MITAERYRFSAEGLLHGQAPSLVSVAQYDVHETLGILAGQVSVGDVQGGTVVRVAAIASRRQVNAHQEALKGISAEGTHRRSCSYAPGGLHI